MYSDTLLIVRWTNLHNEDSGYVSFADLLADDSTTLQAYTDFYPDKPPETTLSLQSDTYGWCDFVVPTTDTEKNQLKAGLEDVASREHTSADAMMYEVFKGVNEWQS